MNDEDMLIEREGYRIFVEPLIGLIRLFITVITSLALWEVLKTEHGRAMVHNLPLLIKATVQASL